MSANRISGTVGAYNIGSGDFPVYEFRAPTAEEVAAAQAEAENRRRLWAENAAAQEKNLRQQKIERARYLEECKRNFPVEGMSGEFDGDQMNVWRVDAEWPYRDVRLIVGNCDFCHTPTSLVEIDNSDGEYKFVSVCRGCLGKMFDAFAAHQDGGK